MLDYRHLIHTIPIASFAVSVALNSTTGVHHQVCDLLVSVCEAMCSAATSISIPDIEDTDSDSGATLLRPTRTLKPCPVPAVEKRRFLFLALSFEHATRTLKLSLLGKNIKQAQTNL